MGLNVGEGRVSIRFYGMDKPSISHVYHIEFCTNRSNRPLSNYASVPANNNLKLRLGALFSYICCIFSHEASTSGYCSRELKRKSKVAYCATSAFSI